MPGSPGTNAPSAAAMSLVAAAVIGWTDWEPAHDMDATARTHGRSPPWTAAIRLSLQFPSGRLLPAHRFGAENVAFGSKTCSERNRKQSLGQCSGGRLLSARAVIDPAAFNGCNQSQGNVA